MRYMQMIKRCKISLKKSPSDMEAHGEEQAKRCTMSTAAGELKPSTTNWEEKLGHLRHSAVARLLVEGTLPAESAPPSPVRQEPEGAMDLSRSSVLSKARNFHREDCRLPTEPIDLIDSTADRLRRHIGREMESLAVNTVAPMAVGTSEGAVGVWKCRYCPYSTNTTKKLYSHYQFHQQLLTSQSSKPHLEWLAAYRHSKDTDGTGSSVTSTTVMTSPPASGGAFPSGSSLFPPGADDQERVQALKANGLSLRYLLGTWDAARSPPTPSGGTAADRARPSCHPPPSATHSASGCLRSIVQAVMQQGAAAPGARGGQAGTPTTSSSVYSTLLNGIVTTGEESTPTISPPAIQPPTTTNTSTITTSIASDTSQAIKEEGGPPRWPVSAYVPEQEAADDDPSSPRQPAVDQVPRRIVKVEHQPPPTSVCRTSSATLTSPERPSSRDSTSSYTSSTESEEINVDDDGDFAGAGGGGGGGGGGGEGTGSDPKRVDNIETGSRDVDRRRMEFMTSELSENGVVPVSSRKRSHSADSDETAVHPQDPSYQRPLSTCSPEHSPTHLPHHHHHHHHHQHQHQHHLQEGSSFGKSPRLDSPPCQEVTPSSVRPSHLDCPVKREAPQTLPCTSPVGVISSTCTSPLEDSVPGEGSRFSTCRPEGATVPVRHCGVQCELLVPPSGIIWQNPHVHEAEQQQQQRLPDQSTNQDPAYCGTRLSSSPTLIGSVKCPHCCISFEDSVLHSIHMGCHSHSDPFICNVCGEHCANRYGFYTHIMRGHNAT